MRSVAVIVIGIGILVWFPFSRSCAADGDLPIEFRDKIQLAYGDYPEEVFIPWNEKDKEAVRIVFIEAQKMAPGVMKRVTMYRPLRLYRCRESRRNLNGLALAKVNGMYLFDGLFGKRKEQLIYTFIHECVHLVDLMEEIETSEEWIGLVLSHMKAVREEVTAKGGKYFSRALGQSDQYEGVEKFRDLPGKEGMPTLYACRNTAEALAECVEETMRGKYEPPKKISAYLDKHVLSLPDQPDPGLESFHQAMEAMVQKKDDIAFDLLTKLIDSRPELRYLSYRRAGLYLKKKKYKEALADLKLASVSFKDSERIRFNISIRRGGILADQRKHKDAISEFTTAIRQFPYVTYAYRKRAESHAKLKDYDSAISDITLAISYTPDDEYLFRTRAIYKYDVGEYLGALADMDTVLKRREGKFEGFDFKYIWERSLIKMKLEDFDGALEDIALYNKLSPFKYPTFEVVQTRSEAYMGAKQYEKALKDFDFLRRAAPKNVKFYQNRLQCLRLLGRLEQAVDELTAILEKDPKRIDVYFMRAPLHKELERPADAEKDYQSLYEKVSTNGRFLQAVAWKLATTKPKTDRDGTQALKFAQKADELSSQKNPTCVATVAAAYAELGDFEKAVIWQKKAIELSGGKNEKSLADQLLLYEQKKTL